MKSFYLREQNNLQLELITRACCYVRSKAKVCLSSAIRCPGLRNGGEHLSKPFLKHSKNIEIFPPVSLFSRLFNQFAHCKISFTLMISIFYFETSSADVVERW